MIVKEHRPRRRQDAHQPFIAGRGLQSIVLCGGAAQSRAQGEGVAQAQGAEGRGWLPAESSI